MGQTAVGFIEPRIRDIAEHLYKLGTLVPRAQKLPPALTERVEFIRLEAPNGSRIVETVTLRPRESLVLTADRSMFAMVGDTDGDEHFRIRIYAASANGVEIVHDESPISPRVHAFGAGVIWIRRDGTLRPNQLLWWHPGRFRPIVLSDEPDPTRRLELRGVTYDTAILASRGPDTTRHWIVHDNGGSAPTSHPFTHALSDVDVTIWKQEILVLDRADGLLWDESFRHLLSEAPAGFGAQYLQPSGDTLFVSGRNDGRQAIWSPAHGSDAVWTAPPAGTMLPAFDSATQQLMLLASSPVHRPQVVSAEVGRSPSLAHTGRAVTVRLSAEGEDGAMVPITLFLPPGGGPHPLVVHVYGAYGISLEGPFDPFTDDLLSRGVAIAYCHIRGGGEFGRQWHRGAVGRYRYRTVDDFLACVGGLRALPAIAADRIVVTAASAGGMTAAAACLRRPMWLRGLHLVHPFVDPLATLMNPASNLASTDRAEYGDPRRDPNIRDLLQRLSPTAIIREFSAQSHPLPRAWIRTAERDTRVDGDAIRRFSLHYRDVSVSRSPGHVIQRIAAGGHLGGASVRTMDDENLIAHAWMLDVLGVPVDQTDSPQ